MNIVHRLIVLLLLVAIVGGAGCFAARVTPPRSAAAATIPGGDFSLQSQAGEVALHDLRGKAVLLYFGYTYCPDACPQALGVMARAIKSLPLLMQRRVAGVFISLDPNRDTPARLRDYTAFFDRRIVGVTGSATALAQVARAYRVSYSVPKHPKTVEYVVSHSTFIYAINPQGEVVALFGDRTTEQEVARTLRAWL